MRPLAKLGPYLLIYRRRLLNPIDRNIRIRNHKRLEMLTIIDDVILNENLDPLPQHCAVFRGSIPLLLNIILIPIALLPIVPAITGFNIDTAARMSTLLGNLLDLRLKSFLLGLALLLLPIPLRLIAFLLGFSQRLFTFVLGLPLRLLPLVLRLPLRLVPFVLRLALTLLPIPLLLGPITLLIRLLLCPIPLLLGPIALLIRLLLRLLAPLLRPMLIPLPLLRSPLDLLLAPLPLALLPIPGLLLPIPNGLLTVPLSLTPAPRHLTHLALLIIIPNRRPYPLHDIRIFPQLVLGNQPVIDIQHSRLIIHINYFVAVPPDMGRKDILPHRREEDMITVPDRIGRILAIGEAGRCGKEEGQCNFQAHGFLFFSMISRGIIKNIIPETPPIGYSRNSQRLQDKATLF
jgi:hypothetical protein